VRSKYASLRRGAVNVVWSTGATGDEADAGILAFERLGGDAGGSYAIVVLNTNQVHPSTTRTADRSMTVTAPPGTELIDALGADAQSYVVGDDGTLDVTVDPMQGVVLVPAAEYDGGV
jgi:hypothetical protein